MSTGMLEVGIEEGRGDSSEIDEQCRKKLAALRDGLRGAFARRGIFISEGESNIHFLSSLHQLMGVRGSAEYTERLYTSWHEEYEQLIQNIGTITGHGEFDADTSLQEVLQSIEVQLGSGQVKNPGMRVQEEKVHSI